MWRAVAPRPARRAWPIIGRAMRSFTWTVTGTPNPDVRKFEPPATAAVSAASGLHDARSRLLELPGVRDVFVPSVGVSGEPWVAVTRAAGENWTTLEPLVVEELLRIPSEGSSADPALPQEAEASALSRVEEEIEEVLEYRVRPGVNADGGDVELASWDAEAGVVTVRMHGACKGCPQSAMTLKESILKVLMHFVPEVKSVVQAVDEPIDTSDDPFADIHWDHDGAPDADWIKSLAAGGTPFFSIFAGTKVEGKILKRVKFASRLALAGRSPGHIFVNCADCGAKKAFEDPKDLLREDKGNSVGSAAVVLCPACCVVITT